MICAISILWTHVEQGDKAARSPRVLPIYGDNVDNSLSRRDQMAGVPRVVCMYGVQKSLQNNRRITCSRAIKIEIVQGLSKGNEKLSDRFARRMHYLMLKHIWLFQSPEK